MQSYQAKKIFGAAVLFSVSALFISPITQAAEEASTIRTISYVAANCANCHGTNGKSAGGSIPPLAGLSANYFVQQMNDFKSGKRQATIMHQIAKGYSDEQIAQLASYFANQKVATSSKK